MKLDRNYLFFLCLFFLKGYGHAFAADEYRFSCLHVQSSAGKNSAEFSRSQNQDILFQYAIFCENDDDDDDSGTARKKPSISRFSALNTVFFLSDVSYSPHSRRRPYEFVDCLPYDRCIFQRVLKV